LSTEPEVFTLDALASTALDDCRPTILVPRVQPVCLFYRTCGIRTSQYEASTFDMAEDDAEYDGLLAGGVMQKTGVLYCLKLLSEESPMATRRYNVPIPPKRLQTLCM
jgi:hypothetical protein